LLTHNQFGRAAALPEGLKPAHFQNFAVISSLNPAALEVVRPRKLIALLGQVSSVLIVTVID
jgi:hypothetical protein